MVQLARLALISSLICADDTSGSPEPEASSPLPAPQRPHILTVIMDDLGYADTAVHNEDMFMTENFGRLAKAGIVLNRHHTYLWCSPTRRSFLCVPAVHAAGSEGCCGTCGPTVAPRPMTTGARRTGRFPVHITGSQAPSRSNFTPLQFTLLPVRAPHPANTVAIRCRDVSVHAGTGQAEAGGLRDSHGRQGPPRLHDDGPPASQQRL